MAETIRGINVQIGSDTTGLSKALSDVNKNARDIQTELRQVERLLKFDPQNTELLAQKQQLLAQAVANTEEKLSRLRSVQEQVNEQFARGEISEGQYRAYQREVAKTEQNLKSLEEQLKATEPAAKSLGERLEEAGESISRAGKKMSEAGKNLSLKVTAPITGLGAAILKTGIDFEASMSKVAAVSGATAEELEALTEQAKELGATTAFSASDAAEGMEYLARAGFSVADIMRAMPGMLDLAASAAVDLGTAADITSNIMSGFGIESEKAAMVADVLAAATSRSNTSVSTIGESMKMVAPVSASLGISMQETAAAIGLLGDAGIQGSMAGTTLRAGLLRLASPTAAVKQAMEELGLEFFDSEGKMKSLTEIIAQLETAMSGMTEQQKTSTLELLFGASAVSGFTALISAGSESLGEFTEQLFESDGAAQSMAQTMMDNARGGVEELKSALEGVAIQLSEILIPVFNEVIGVLQKVVGWFANLDKGTQKTIVIVAGLAAAIGPLLIALGAVASGITKLIPIIGVLGNALTFLATNPVGVIVTAIAGLVSGLVYLYKTNEEVREKLNVAWNFLKRTAESIFGDIQRFWEKWGSSIVELFQSIFSVVQDTVSTIFNDIKAFWDTWGGTITTLFRTIFNVLKTVFEGTWDSIKIYLETTMNVIKAIFEGAWNGIRIIIETAIGIIQNTIKLFLSVLKGDWEGAWDAIKGIVETVWEGIKKTFGNVYETMSKIGKEIIQGLVDGVKNMASKAISAAREVARGVGDAVKDFFRISSPSRLMIELGSDVGEGLALGIRQSVDVVKQQAQFLSNAAMGAIAPALETPQHNNRLAMSGAPIGGSIVQNITINSPQPLSPSETARRNLQASRQLAMEWGIR